MYVHVRTVLRRAVETVHSRIVRDHLFSLLSKRFTSCLMNVCHPCLIPFPSPVESNTQRDITSIHTPLDRHNVITAPRKIKHEHQNASTLIFRLTSLLHRTHSLSYLAIPKFLPKFLLKLVDHVGSQQTPSRSEPPAKLLLFDFGNPTSPGLGLR